MDSELEQQLEKIMPEDLARTFESAYHVIFQGQHEHMDDLLKHGGVLLRKAAQRLTSTQLILGIATIAAVAVVLVNRSMDDDHEGEARDVSPKNRAQIGGNKEKGQDKGQGQGKGQDRSE